MAHSADSGSAKPKWLPRVGWLLALWFGGVFCLGGAAWLLKSIMRAVGFA